jgi:dihydrofolate reductase
LADLIYSAISSLDGYIEDMDGNFDWAAPDEQVHSFINDLERSTSTYLFGRRMYETLQVWETDPNLAADSPIMRDFAEMWQAANKIVFSKTLQTVSTRKTQIERNFDPEAIRQLKRTAEQDISIGGPDLAAHAFRAGLIDECHLFLAPILVGAGKPSLPANLRLELDLLEQHRFDNGMVFLRYRVRQEKAA